MIKVDIKRRPGAKSKLDRAFNMTAEMTALNVSRLLQKDIVDSIDSSPPKGKVYKKAFGIKDDRKYPHTASRPGNPPRNWTYALRSGIEIKGRKADYNVLSTAKTPSGFDYGIALEFGTKNMAARPFMVPAAERIKPLVTKIFLKFYKQSLKTVGFGKRVRRR